MTLVPWTIAVAAVVAVACGAADAVEVTPICSSPAEGEDCTKVLQDLIYNASVSTIHLAATYITTPLFVNRSGLTVRCSPTAVLLAKRWAFNSTGAVLLTVVGVANFRLEGCRLRMWRSDYANRAWYRKGEWRHTLSLQAVSNATIRDCIFEESGGDGIYLSSVIRDHTSCSRNVLIERVTSRNNYRQGISVICADGVAVRDSTFEGTRGTNPQCGVDIEPDVDWQMVNNLTFSNILFRNNSGCQISVSTYALRNVSQPHSVSFENITAVGTPGYGIILNVPHDHSPPSSTITFRRLRMVNSSKFGIFGMSANLSHGITFADVTLQNTSTGPRDSIAVMALYVDRMRNVAFGVPGAPLTVLDSDADLSRNGPFAVYMQGSPKKDEPAWTNGTGLTAQMVVHRGMRKYACLVEGPKDVKERFNVSCEP